MENSQFDTQESENGTDIKKLVLSYLRYWYYFVVSVLVCFFAVHYYLKHTTPIYQSDASIKIVDDSKNNITLPTSNGVTFLPKSKINLDNEIEILKSYRILEKVCKNLDLDTRYYKVGYFNKFELWKNKPFTIEWLASASQIANESVSFEFEIVKGGYRITDYGGKSINKVYPFNTVQYLNHLPYKLVFHQGVAQKNYWNQKYLIAHTRFNETISELTNSVNIENVNDKVDVITISLQGSSNDKSEVVINEIIKQYDIDGINDRRLVYKRTIDFINDRFKKIAKELDSIEVQKANYKKNNELIFLESDADMVSNGKNDNENNISQLETQMVLSKILNDNLKSESDDNFSLLPNNIGVLDVDINDLITTYNSVVLDLDRLSVSSGNNNPIRKGLVEKLHDTKTSIFKSIKQYQQELQASITKNGIARNGITDRFGTMPFHEKVLNGIERQRNVKEALYLLLLQKREEAALNSAVTTSSIKVVDYALTNMNPVSPKKNTIILGSIIVGLLIPFLVIYIVFLFDDKLNTKEDVAQFAKNKIIIAEVPHIESEDRMTSVNDRSFLGESFRILRTNLSYVLPLKVNGLGQVILVTSTIKGEGKTFTTVNLSISFSLLDKKVLLIGSDLRNPQLHNYVNINKNLIGLQDYLYDSTIDWKTIVNKNQLNNSNLDIIFSGKIPPNPAELLSNGRLSSLIDEAKKEYDYIIVDSAPTLLVADTLLVSQLVDTTLYVIRAGFTPKKILEYSVGLSDKKKLKNMVYVINNIGVKDVYGYNYRYSYKYNYGYGYGYNEESTSKNSILKKITSFFTKKSEEKRK